MPLSPQACWRANSALLQASSDSRGPVGLGGMAKPPPKPPHIEVLRTLLPAGLAKAEIEAEEARFWTYLRLYRAAAKRAVEGEQDSTLCHSDSMLGDIK